MVRAIQMITELGAVRRFLAGVQGACAQYAGELDLIFDSTVLVEVPIHAVLIITDCANERHDESSKAPRLGLLRAKVAVLPANAEILFVDTNRLRNLDDCAFGVAEVCVEIVDVAQTIAAQ